MLRSAFLPLVFAVVVSCGGIAQNIPISKALDNIEKHNTLAALDTPPFYLKARITHRNQPNYQYNGEVELWWASPQKWRRTYKSQAFSQTLIANGDKQQEEDSADFFPPEIEKLIVSITDPVRPDVMAEFRKLPITITPFRFTPKMCLGEEYFHYGDDPNARAVIALSCQTGLLQYAWFPGWNSGVFDDYRKFHKKEIAFRSKDNEVNFEIEELRDMGTPDESMFTAANPTAPSGRIRTVRVSESDYRPYVLESPQAKWPTLTKSPASGKAFVQVVVDRAGNVRESRCYVLDNDEVRAPAEEAIRSWKFKPYLVDGAPLQVESTITLQFSSEPSPAASLGSEQATAAPQPSVRPDTRSTSDSAPQTAALAQNANSPPLRVRVSQGVLQRVLIHQTAPVYPRDARRDHIQGAVVMKAMIGKDGNIKDLQVVSGPEELVPAATYAVQQWRYKPWIINGEAVEVETIITVNFRLAE